MPSVFDLGYREPFVSAFSALQEPDLQPARVCAAHRGAYSIWHADGVQSATVSGRLRHLATDAAELPAVGDWVAARHLAEPGKSPVIEAVLPRHSVLCRARPAELSAAQVIATNLDTVFIVSALNRDFNPRRLERYLALVWQSGAEPVVVLNKADLSTDAASDRARAVDAAPGAAVVSLSCLTGDGLSQLDPYLTSGRTIALIGSSGVGKSTLVNALLGDARLSTGEIRADDDRGKHTTTRRELVALPSGALLIDTPGMREVGLWDAEEGLETAFGDVEVLAEGCRFRDCGHTDEPGCAVRSAVELGELSAPRYRSYLKLQRELAYLDRQRDERARREHRTQVVREFKARNRSLRRHPKRPI